MIITCQSCKASFNLDDRLIKPAGSKVRCSKCAKVFTVFPKAPEPVEETEIVLELEPDQMKTPEPQQDKAPESTAAPEAVPPVTAKTPAPAAKRAFPDPASGEPASEEKEMPEEGSLSGLEMDMADIDGFLSFDTPEETSGAQTAVPPVGEGSGLSGQESDDELTDMPELEDLDLQLDPEDDAGEFLEEDLDLGLDLDLENGTEVSTELKRSGDKGMDLDLTDIDLSELDRFFEGKGVKAPPVEESESILAGLEMEKQMAAGSDGEEVFDLDDLELELETQSRLETREAATVPSAEDDSKTAVTYTKADVEAGRVDIDALERSITDEVEAVAVTAGAAAVFGQKGALEEDGPIEKDRSASGQQAPERPPIEERLEKKKIQPSPAASQAKRKTAPRVPLMAALLLLLVAAGGYAVYQMGGQWLRGVPLLNRLAPAPADPAGNLNIKTLEIATKFVDNLNEGRLFVISGKAMNGYPTPRSGIRIRGHLLTDGRISSEVKTVLAGNVLSDAELVTLDMPAISQQLNALPPAGRIEPGQSLPFMLIFSKLPEKLDEFVLEVAGSAPSS